MSYELEQYIKTASDRHAVEVEGCYWDETEANKFRDFYEAYGCLTERCHAGNVGDPIHLINWQWEEIILPYFAWKRPDGSRRFSKIYCFIPKKQNKSGLIAMLALYHLFNEPAALCQIFASNVKQSRVVFDFAQNTVRYGPLNPYIGKGGNNKIWIRESEKRLVWTNATGVRSSIQAMASTPEGVSGPSASLVICDEICEWGGTHARIIWDRLQSSTAARSGSHMVISTPQFDTSHIGFELWSEAKNIIDGVIINTGTLPILYTIPQDADCICGKCEGDKEAWKCPEWWYRANPSIGITTPKKYLHDKFNEVLNNPLNEASFRTLNCGQWVGHAIQWIPSNVFIKCKEDFNEADLHGKPAWIGIDMAHRYDLACYVVAVKRGDFIYLMPRIFIPEEMAERKEKMDRVPYRRWRDLGFVKFTNGDVIDPSEIRRQIMIDNENFDLQSVRYDKYGMEETRQILEEDLNCEVVELPQSAGHMGPPTAYFEQLVNEKRLKYSNEVLSWCLGNCTPKQTDDIVTVDKKRSTGRIDAVVASIIALSGINSDEDKYINGDPCFFV